MSTYTPENTRRWRAAGAVQEFANRVLRPAEAMILLRHRADLGDRVLEIGCGAGRVTGYLLELAVAVTGIDIAADMVEHCRAVYPAGTFAEADLRDLGGFADATFEAVVAPFNVISVLGHDERGRFLDELARILVPGGLLVFSAHNRAFIPHVRSPAWVVARDPLVMLERLRHLPRSVRNHRRLRRLERSEQGYALVNDNALDFGLLHYYIGRDEQERQLAEHGFSLIECLALDGSTVPPGEPAAGESELHYVARLRG